MNSSPNPFIIWEENATYFKIEIIITWCPKQLSSPRTFWKYIKNENLRASVIENLYLDTNVKDNQKYIAESFAQLLKSVYSNLALPNYNLNKKKLM